jgi:hypothetical protein
MRLGRYHPRAQCQALQRCQAEHTCVGIPTRRQKATSASKSSWKNHDKEDQKSEAYILERTRAFFTGRSSVRGGAARGRRWSVSSSTSRRRGLGRAGSASSGGVVDAEELGAQRASARGRRSRWEGKVPNQRSMRGF